MRAALPSLLCEPPAVSGSPQKSLDVFDVCGVGLELLHQAVVVGVGFRAQRLLTFEHQHCRTVGIEFAEDLADVPHGQDAGASGAFRPTDRSQPTTSSWGTAALVIAAMATHASTMGNASRRIHRATSGPSTAVSVLC